MFLMGQSERGMDKRRCASKVARCARDGFLFPVTAFTVILVALVISGCSARDSAADRDRSPTFYGGVSVGGSIGGNSDSSGGGSSGM